MSIPRMRDSHHGLLELARHKFPEDGPQDWMMDSQGELMGDEYRRDQLAWHYERLRKKDEQAISRRS